MEQFLTWLDPQPVDVPARLNSPFDVGAPSPLVVRALEVAMAPLRGGWIAPGVPVSRLHGPEGGKMFGVLVVRAPDGRVGLLRAISGQLDRRWDVEGHVPPVFDRALREAVEVPGERTVKALTERVEAWQLEREARGLARDLAAIEREHAASRAALKATHEARRQARHEARANLTVQGAELSTALRALERASQADDVELRDAKREWKRARATVEAALAAEARRTLALERLRRVVSQEVSWQIYDSYLFENARGVRRSLRALFEPKVPSSGTGDCAAPKLLVFARRHGLTPLGIAEFWWGAPPPGGGRVEGELYPACKDKCGPLLPFLLEGVDVAPSRRHRPTDFASRQLELVHADERLLVIDKPEGLLSVPGTDDTVTDSVLARVREAYPHATGPLLVHRLDLETSGLLCVALDAEAAVALQAQFIERTVEKRYVAILDGVVEPDEGTIELPLRVDLEQRPRQLVDFEHGKPALTHFTVLERANGRTRVAFFPKTGRTHQLRVHAAHAQGLGLPIVGDRLYGRADKRLFLHAERLAFTHPGTGHRVVVERGAPF